MDITIHDGTLCDSHGWHSGTWCYRCKFEALEMRHDQVVDELDLMRKNAERYCEEAKELKEALDESSRLHLSTVRLITRMEKEQDRLRERLSVYECDNCTHILTGTFEDGEVCRKCADKQI